MTDNTAQKASANYRLPALDQDFLLGNSMRGVRLQLEYEKAEEQLRAWWFAPPSWSLAVHALLRPIQARKS